MLPEISHFARGNGIDARILHQMFAFDLLRL